MSNRILVDTNVIIDLFAKRVNLHTNKLQQLMADDAVELYINDFVMSEVLQGIELSAANKYNKAKEELQSSFNIINVDSNIILKSVTIYRECKAGGINFNNENICPVQDCNKIIYNSIDCIHYATCMEYKLKLLTNDKLFKRIDEYKNLQLVEVVTD